MEEIEACIADQKNIEEEIEVRELACIIESFLDTLTIENRVIFMRRYWYLSPIKEISTDYSISESKVKMSLLRSRNELRQLLEKEGINL